MKRDAQAVREMIEAARAAQEAVAARDERAFLADADAQAVVAAHLRSLAQAAERTSEKLRSWYPGIPWADVLVLQEEGRCRGGDHLLRVAAEDMPVLIRLLGPLAPPPDDPWA